MKKVFKLQDDKRKPERIVEAIKHEIRKYMKRERKKKLPEGATYWEFDCRFGKDAEHAAALNSPELITSIDRAREEEWGQCYVELLVRPVYKKEAEEAPEEQEDAAS